MTALLPLQIVSGLGGIALGFVLSMLVIALGTYIGVSMALQSFFDAPSWDEVGPDSED